MRGTDVAHALLVRDLFAAAFNRAWPFLHRRPHGLKLKFSGLKTRRHDKKITQGMGMETFAVLFMIHALNRKVPWPIVLELEE